MVAAHEWFSPTRTTGLAAFGASALACAYRWARFRGSHVSGRPFAILAGVQTCLLLDIVFDWRWQLHDMGIRKAIAMGVYDQRSAPQVLALAALSLGVALTCLLIVFQFRARLGVALAMAGTVLSVGLWCAECVSYHVVDRYFYHFVGNLMVVSLLWVSIASITCFGAWIDGRGTIGAIPIEGSG